MWEEIESCIAKQHPVKEQDVIGLQHKNHYQEPNKELPECEAAFEAGMDDFTEKPIISHTLLATMKQHL